VIYWVWRQFRHRPARSLLSCLVFGAVTALCLLFEGIRFGIYDDLRRFPASLPADLVAVERGSGYFAMSPSKLPQLSRAQAESVAGVRSAHPLLVLPVIFDANALRSPGLVVGYDTRGAPRALVSGRLPQGAREMVLDARLAHRHGVSPGDRVSVLDFPLTVTGLSDGTASPFTPYLFITFDDLIDLLLESDLPVGFDDLSLLSFLLIEASPGTELAALRRALVAAMPEAELFTPAELGANDSYFGERLIGPILSLIISMAWIIAFLAMALLRYADVQSQLREFGVQKALGAGPAALTGSLAAGGLLTALASLPLALLIAAWLAGVTAGWNPLYAPQIWQPDVLVRGIAAALAASVAGSLVHLRRLSVLDPALVFQR
jgi:hypothetical protein